ncbi:uncharacterized protein IUM83_01812 [Phytophthora cinnamomi]|uniref:uncharacterized protein n=1 Tax=Phytophthora cinnamomi TaxID=4785 RepID=UPI00355A5CED|nr:hypothetical protein IUM83_01812 [Phytophthora cinnamomi]
MGQQRRRQRMSGPTADGLANAGMTTVAGSIPMAPLTETAVLTGATAANGNGTTAIATTGGMQVTNGGQDAVTMVAAMPVGDAPSGTAAADKPAVRTGETTADDGAERVITTTVEAVRTVVTATTDNTLVTSELNGGVVNDEYAAVSDHTVDGNAVSGGTEAVTLGKNGDTTATTPDTAVVTTVGRKRTKGACEPATRRSSRVRERAQRHVH